MTLCLVELLSPEPNDQEKSKVCYFKSTFQLSTIRHILAASTFPGSQDSKTVMLLMSIKYISSNASSHFTQIRTIFKSKTFGGGGTCILMSEA